MFNILTTLALLFHSLHFPLNHASSSTHMITNSSQIFTNNTAPSNPNPTIGTLPTPANDSPGWIYPHATISSVTGETTELQTTDDPSVVTNWYQAQLKIHHFNTTSVIRNAINGTISNSLIGQNNASFFQVEIKQNAGEIATAISVTIHNK